MWQQHQPGIVKINIYKAFDKEAEVGSYQRLSASGIHETNAKASKLKKHGTAISFAFRCHPRPLRSHSWSPAASTLPLPLLEYNKCRINLTCGTGEGAHTVYIKGFQRKQRGGKPLNVLSWCQSKISFPQSKHRQSHRAELPAHNNTANCLIADLGAFSLPTWNCLRIVYFKTRR